MTFLEIVFIGIGLSMDAFTVAMGMSSTLHCFRNRLFLSFLFGLFQALMILLGYYFGSFFPFISTFKNFFSCCLLSYVGVHMIYDSFLKTEYPSFSFLSSLFLAVATSIDAFCVGFQFSFYPVSLFFSAFLIGMITFLCSFFGCFLGMVTEKILGQASQIFGGVILILFGIHFLF